MSWPTNSLAVLCFLLVLLGACSPPAGIRVASATVTAARTDVAAMEEEIRQKVNAVRQKRGLAPLRANAAVAKVAKEHSRRMAKADFFAHEDPRRGNLVERLDKAGIAYRVAAENLLTTTNIPDPVAAAVDGWMKSKGHRTNILRKDVTETGVGIWRDGQTFYFTQIFLRPSPR